VTTLLKCTDEVRKKLGVVICRKPVLAICLNSRACAVWTVAPTNR